MAEAQDLAAQYVGDGFPVLIVHGWTMAGFVESEDFEPIFTQTPGYRRIYVDLPGMGSTPAGDMKDLDSILERLSAFVEKHILPSNFLLVGSSCGAYLARALAFKHSDAVEGLLLRVPVVEPHSPKRDVDAFVPIVADATVLSSLSEADRAYLGGVPVQTPEYVERLKRKLDAAWLPATEASDSARLDKIRKDPHAYRLTAPMHTTQHPFTKPALIVTGRQDADVGYRDAWPLTAAYPRATYIALDRADHGLPVDQNDLFDALVKNWLWRVEDQRRLVVPS